VDFSWDSAGLIDVVTRFVAIPDVTLSLSSNKIDQTVLAAFVLHVLLTAAQLSVLMYSLFCKLRQTSANWNTIQVILQSPFLCNLGRLLWKQVLYKTF